MLYIAEKPELARAIVDGLGGGAKRNGYYECGNDKVTWCFGHMLELCEPEDIEPSLKQWRMEDLPLFFLPWKKKPIPKSGKQFAVIVELLREAETVVHAGDPDAEGQLLIDEVLKFAGYQGPIKRVLINDNTPAAVKKALAAMRDNAEFAGLSASAEARQLADKLYGYNLTRLYTLAARAEGHPGLISIGRVQTPILGLVVRRDQEHGNHQKTAYYAIRGNFRSGDSCFTAAYQTHPDDPQDGDGRLSHYAHAKDLADSLPGKSATVASFDAKKGETPPPLPYNLLKLQADASRLLGFPPDKVKEITQNLREKHRLITYNRSDCQFIPEEQHADAPEVIAAIAANVPELASVPELNPLIKSRAFDSGKVSAHHAIIPTRSRADFSRLTESERSVYRLIARAYLVQFLPNHAWERATTTVSVGDRTFVGRSRNTIAEGWRAFYQQEAQDGADENESSIVRVSPGQEIACDSCDCLRKETAPKPLYTMSALLGDLTRVAQYVRDDRLKKLLIDKDRGKEGENGGIGTPATRDEVIKTLFQRGFIETRKTGKTANVVSTALGREVYGILPDDAKYPDLTAIWHERQRAIERGEIESGVFIDELLSYLGKEVARVVADGLGICSKKHPCPKCGSAMLRRSGKKGFFWGCAKYPACTAMLPDHNGEPGNPAAKAETAMSCPDCGKPMRYITHAKGNFYGCTGYPGCRRVIRAQDGKPDSDKTGPRASAKHQCLVCGKPLVRRPGKEDGQHFWGCTDYPKCRNTYPDHGGKPKYGTQKRKDTKHA